MKTKIIYHTDGVLFGIDTQYFETMLVPGEDGKEPTKKEVLVAETKSMRSEGSKKITKKKYLALVAAAEEKGASLIKEARSKKRAAKAARLEEFKRLLGAGAFGDMSDEGARFMLGIK